MQRNRGLDGLIGLAMLLGIVLHGSLPYFSRMVGFESIWPAGRRPVYSKRLPII